MKNENLLCARNARACARTLLHPTDGFTLPRDGDREQRLSIGCSGKERSYLEKIGMKSSKVPLFLTVYHEFEKSQVFLL